MSTISIFNENITNPVMRILDQGFTEKRPDGQLVRRSYGKIENLSVVFEFVEVLHLSNHEPIRFVMSMTHTDADSGSTLFYRTTEERLAAGPSYYCRIDDQTVYEYTGFDEDQSYKIEQECFTRFLKFVEKAKFDPLITLEKFNEAGGYVRYWNSSNDFPTDLKLPHQ